MEITAQQGIAYLGLVALGAFLALYLWDRLTPTNRAHR